ncbi:MAG: R3H domain-containing nucleic acid-binding protein [Petrotogales bacterium]
MSDYKNNEINLLDEEKKAFEVLTRIINTIAEGAEVNKVFSDQDYTVFEISKADPAIVIGKHGHTLDAIQYLVNMVANKENVPDTQRLYVIDIDGYRKRREESLKRYAKEKAEIVKRRGKAIALYFMNSIERRLVHLSLKDDPEVTTYSEGKDPFRRVIISPETISKTDYGQRDE